MPQEQKSKNWVHCPQCKKKILYDLKNEFRPFCSKLCKLEDLGNWAEDKYTIPGPATNENEDD